MVPVTTGDGAALDFVGSVSAGATSHFLAGTTGNGSLLASVDLVVVDSVTVVTVR